MKRGVRIARLAPPLTLAVLLGPLVFGLAGTTLPAFGYLPGLGGHTLSLEHFKELADIRGIWRSAFLSMLTGLITPLVALFAVAGFMASDLGTRIFARIRAMISPLLSVPHAAAAFGLAFLIAPSGMIMRLISPWPSGFERPPDLLIIHDPLALAMMAGLIVKEIPFLFLVMLAALPQTRHSDTMRLGRSLGYGRIASFTYLLWPALYRQTRLAVFAVIAYASSVVDVALILGPHLPPPLPVQLLKWMNDPDLQTRFLASAGAMMQLAVTLVALIAWVGLEKAGALLVCFYRNRGRRLRYDGPARYSARVLMIASAAVVFGGIAMLALWSIAGLWQFPDSLPADFRLRNWLRALPHMSALGSIPLQIHLQEHVGA